MCFGTFILLAFICALCMPLYFEGGHKRKHKNITIQKKVINHRHKKYESCRQEFKENRILTVTSMYILEVCAS